MERSRRSRTASAADVEAGQSPMPRAPQRMPPRQPNGSSWRSPRRLTRLLVVCGGLYMAAVLFWYSRRGSTGSSSSVWPLTVDETADGLVAAPRSVRFRDGDAVYALDGKDPDETTAPEDELEDDDEQLHRIDLAEAMRNADHNLSPKEILAQLANLGPSETKPPAATVDEATIAAAEEHARHVKLLPMREKKTRRFRCVGWRSTGECSPFGPRTPAGDQSCSRTIPPGESGYCEIEDKDSGERFRVMQLHCDSLLPTARFRCFEAWDFANLHIQARDAFLPALKPGYVLENIAPQPADQQQTDGIIMVVYPKLVPSAYATIRALRAMGCSLPVEIWFRPDEIRSFPPALQLLNASFGPVTFRAIDYTRAVGFATKIHALMHSQFERVLFLDADNVPVRDPTYLFSTREFVETGAIFWPDFWHPGHSIFNVHAKSPLWELLDMPFVNMFEQESGQLLIDRRRHAAPLELVQFFTYHRPNHFERLKLVYGDKDLFRLAWLKTEHAFHMIQTPPSIAGKVVNGSLFCGMTMAQHDPAGDVLFLHRNSRKLLGAKEERPSKRMALTRRERKELRRQILARRGIVVPKSADLDDPDDEDGEEDKVEEDKEDEDPLEADGLPDPIMWTHLFSFKRGASRKHYVVGIYKVLPFLPESQSCYGEARAFESNYFTLTAFADMPFASLENELRAFAHEAAQLDATGKR